MLLEAALALGKKIDPLLPCSRIAVGATNFVDEAEGQSSIKDFFSKGEGKGKGKGPARTAFGRDSVTSEHEHEHEHPRVRGHGAAKETAGSITTFFGVADKAANSSSAFERDVAVPGLRVQPRSGHPAAAKEQSLHAQNAPNAPCSASAGGDPSNNNDGRANAANTGHVDSADNGKRDIRSFFTGSSPRKKARVRREYDAVDGLVRACAAGASQTSTAAARPHAEGNGGQLPWSCSVCTLINTPSDLNCAACESLRGDIDSKLASMT